MKATQKTGGQPYSDFDQLITLLSSSHLLEEKTRINLYLPRALVTLMDALAENQSRSEFVKDLVVNQAKTTPKILAKAMDPYGMFADAKITDQDINEITKSWDKHVNQLANEL